MEERYLDKLIKHRKWIYPPSMEEIASKIENIREVMGFRWAGLYSALFLTGGRVSEVLSLTPEDMSFQSEQREKFAVILLRTLKNRQKGLRSITIPLQTETERALFEPMQIAFEHTINDRVFADCGSRNNVSTRFSQKISFKARVMDLASKKDYMADVKLHAHLLRHFRLTHMVQTYHFDAVNLMLYAGWSSLKPAQVYLSVSPVEQMKLFISAGRDNKV